MSDFMNDFWDLFIIVLSVLSIAGCALLLWSQSVHKLAPGDDPQGTTGHVWDEDLMELNTPMPRWWMWLFYLTIAFSVAYLYLYPGLGSYGGQLGWKSSTEYQAELKQANADYAPLFKKYLAQEIPQVAADPKARLIGERLFLTYCAQCHGSDARGNKGFPNLGDRDWLYGGTPDAIKATIMQGRHGVMPSMSAALGSDADVENVAHYVVSMSEGSTSDPIKAFKGKGKFGACMACHGADARGNQALGAPNLTDRVWLYGGSAETVMETIRKGRSNTMPAFGEFLGESKVHLLSAYVWGLSQPKLVAAGGK
jgi:cytochrome c oxidase cbb3-type subunit 3